MNKEKWIKQYNYEDIDGHKDKLIIIINNKIE